MNGDDITNREFCEALERQKEHNEESWYIHHLRNIIEDHIRNRKASKTYDRGYRDAHCMSILEQQTLREISLAVKDLEKELT